MRIRFDRPVAGRLEIADAEDEVILETSLAPGSTETVVRLRAGLYRVTFTEEGPGSRTANRVAAIAGPTTLQMNVPA